MPQQKRAIVAVTMVAAALLLSGCWGSPGEELGEMIIEKTVESQTGGKVDIDADSGEMKIKSDEGEFSMSGTGSATLHEDFPKEIYIAPDAKISLSMANGKDNSFTVAYTSAMGPEEINAKYKETLASNGWAPDSQTEIIMGDSRTILYKKGTQRLTLIVGKSTDSDQEGKTYVQVIGADDTKGGN